jgi:hypothetical protein
MATNSNFLPYEEALAFVLTLNIKNKDEWYTYCKSGNKPKNIPSTPSLVYKDKGWVNFYVWLNNRNYLDRIPFVSYEDARAYALTTGIKTSIEWRCNDNHPSWIPKEPYSAYKDKGWESWAAFLDSDKISNTKRRDFFIPYEEARDYVHSLRILGHKEWEEYNKSGERPNFIPSMPHKHYKDNGWIDWYDWLNIDNQREDTYITYEEAKEYALKNKISGRKGWLNHLKSINSPKHIPADVEEMYAGKGWVNWDEFLNNQTLNYGQARTYMQKQKFTSIEAAKEFLHSTQRPSFLPPQPNIHYRGKGWVSWKDFVGGAGAFLSYEEARAYAQSLNLKNSKGWLKYHKENKRPRSITLKPQLVYKKSGWTGWLDFLGKNEREPLIKNRFPLYEEAHNYAKSLNLKGLKEWREHTNTPDFPYNIPKTPDKVYKDEGWVSWKVFLGSEFANLDRLKEIMREFNITKVNEYHRLRKLRPDLRIPSNPVSRLFIDVKLGNNLTSQTYN